MGKAGTLVIIRHGQSEYNLADRFAGWVDTGLTPKGRADAKHAGEALRKAGFTPDVVYASTLARAIDTAVEMGFSRDAIEQRESLLERHYGGLTGKNKTEFQRDFPEDYRARRSYSIRPPAMQAEHSHHPQSASAELKVLGLPENGAESLQDVEARVLPFWQGELLPKLLAGEKVLIAAHGNSLRALVKIIERMTVPEVEALNIENAEPVAYEISAGEGGWAFTKRAV